MAKRVRLIGGGALFLLLLYLALFPRPLGPELIVTVEEGITLQDAAPSSVGAVAPLFPFQLGPNFGYIAAGGELVFMDSIQGGVALSPEGFINYSTVSETHVYQDGYGRIQQVIQASGYPVLRAGRVFVIGPGGAQLSEWNETGARIWEREFGSLITAFDATNTSIVVGLVSGELVFLNEAGNEIQRYRSRRSRVPVIYGLHVDESESQVALVSGLDPQVLTVLEFEDERYAPRFEHELHSELREPVQVRFLESAGRLVLEQVDSVGSSSLLSLRRDGREAAELSLPGRLHSLLEPGEIPVLVALAEDSQTLVGFELLFWAGADRIAARIPFDADVSFLGDGPEGSFLLGIDARVLQLRLEER
ncbi:MAG: PQQ-like beta-propeller repeat protein [Spirochaeta sp.]|nr:PQQ-like beta-propeller repeat protein [Spirochaeta sp.]